MTDAADFSFAASVGEALLRQFRGYAQHVLEVGNLNPDLTYDKVLKGLEVAVQQAGGAVVEQLLEWRRGVKSGLARERGETSRLRKQLLAEAVFLEGALRLLAGGCGILSARQAGDLEGIAFDWVLNAEKNVDHRFPDLHRLRDRVVLGSSKLLGCISPIQLGSIADRFLAESGARLRADANSPQRNELYALCHGLRFVRLHGDTPEQLKAAIGFLERVHPLKSVAPQKKSRVQQAICDMLACVLQPLADAADPSSFAGACDAALRKQWFSTVGVLRTDLLKWATKQSKQVPAGFPVVAALTCLEQEAQMIQSIDSFIDQLHRQIKDKKNASMALLCLCRSVWCFLRRMGGRGGTPQLRVWVDRSVAPAVHAMTKGMLIAPEQQELLRLLCLIVSRYVPEYAIHNMVLELLQLDGAIWESPMAGLMALLSILVAAPAWVGGADLAPIELQAAVQGLERASYPLWSAPEDATLQLLELIRSGYNPLDAYGIGALMPKVSAALSKLMLQCHNLYGYSRMTTITTRSMLDTASRERLGALPVFVMTIQCVPFVMPNHWLEGSLFEDLPNYTLHAELSVRLAAVSVLRRCLYALPAVRDKLVSSMVTLAVRQQDDLVEIIKESLNLAMSLLQEWTALQQEAAAPDARPQASSFDSIGIVEGMGLTLLCASDIEIRRLAIELLKASKQLHVCIQRQAGAGPEDSGIVSARGASSVDGSAGDGAAADQSRVYVIDVIQKSGAAMVRRCYWDFGRWSDMWRDWRPAPESETSFLDCMLRTKSAEDNVRWARIICNIMRECWQQCEAAAWHSHLEVATKLQALLSLDSNGRQVLAPENKPDLSRVYCMAYAAAPLMDSSTMGDKALVTKDFLRLLVSSARSGIDHQQQIAVSALGNIHHSCHSMLVLEASQMAEDYAPDKRTAIPMPPVPGMGRASKMRKDDVRLTQANMYRVLSANLPESSLMKNAVVRDKLHQFVLDTARHVSTTGETSAELLQLRYCMCVVARQCSLQLAEALPQAFTADLRGKLFDMFSFYCEEGQQPGHFRAELRRVVNNAKAKVKDPELSRILEMEITDSTEMTEHAAYLGMAAMLQGALFNADVRNPQGRVFNWVDRLLLAAPAPAQRSRLGEWGPPRGTVAHLALRNLLMSNAELAAVFVDRSYSANPHVAAGYFKVLAEVYSARALPVEQHAVISLVLHKVVDPRQDIRDAARGLLRMLARRAWGRDTRFSDQGGTAVELQGIGDVMLGELADSHQLYQLRLSARLAKEHPELSEDVAIEVVGRQLENEPAAEALLCLAPWLEHLTLSAQWQGQWAERLLHLLYSITAQQSLRRAHEVQTLWSTLAANRRNVVPVLDFLISRSMEECVAALSNRSLVPGAIGKQVSLYLARVATRQTIDHLVHEMSRQIDEPPGALAAVAADASTPQSASTAKILEFNQARASVGDRRSLERQTSALSWGPDTPASSTANAGLGLILKTGWSETSNGAVMEPATSRLSSDTRGLPEAPFIPSSGSIQPGPSSSLTRPEVAICLLSEIAFEHDEEFRPHLPVLLHVATLNADSLDPLVRRECCNLLVHLLYSLSCKQLELQPGGGASEDHKRVAGVIAQLQALQGAQLWPREQPTLAVPVVPSAHAVAAFVRTVVECFPCDVDVRERWWAEALKWACAAHIRQYASRSHQVFCALQPALSSTSCTAMLAALHKCLQNANAQSLDTAVEVLCTLHALLSNLEPGKAVLYPQVLLACVALLNSSVVRIVQLAMGILLQILGGFNLDDATTQNALLSMLPLPGSAAPAGADENAGISAPQRDPVQALAAEPWPLGQGLLGGVPDVDEEALGPWLALQQLLVKALFQPETDMLALQVMAAIAQQLASSQLGAQRKGNAGAAACGRKPLSSVTLQAELMSCMLPSARADIEVVLGSTEAGMAISLAAALPWLCEHLAEPACAAPLAAFLESTGSACAAVGWLDLSAAAATVARRAGSPADAAPAAWLPSFCQSFCGTVFPAHSRLVLQRLMEVVRRGAPRYQVAAIGVLRAIFEVPGLEVGSPSWVAEDSAIMGLLADRVASPLGPAVLELFQALVNFQGGAHIEDDVDLDEPYLEWPNCMDDLGECNKLCAEALGRVVDACPGAGQLLGSGGSKAEQLLPFLSSR